MMDAEMMLMMMMDEMELVDDWMMMKMLELL
jgi:hypothetical protein